MNEDAAYRARILDYAQTLLQKYPQRKRRQKIMLFVFGILALVIAGATIFAFAKDKSSDDLTSVIIWVAILALMARNEWRSYKSFQHYESLCQAIVYLSKDK